MPIHRIEEVDVEGHAGLGLASPEGLHVTFVPGAGMIGTSLCDDGVELLGQGQGLRAYVERGRWFGIPLLHPWANRLGRNGFRVGEIEVGFGGAAPLVRRDEAGLPIHGLMAGARDWIVRERGSDADRAFFEAVLDFARDPQRLIVFPFPHRLRVAVALSGRSLEVTTTLESTGRLTLPVAFGWHPYFRLPGVARADWRVTLPVRARARLDSRCLPTGEVERAAIRAGPLGARTYDDLFTELAPGEPFVLEGGGRRIEVHFGEGYEVAVVYAPADADVVCFEPMTAPTDPFEGSWPVRTLAPGERFRARFEIRVPRARG